MSDTSTFGNTRATHTKTGSDARRVGLACGIGTAVERYDFFIYGTAAAVVFGPQFFPQVSEVAGRLAAFATFAIGFVALPLGGMVMGHFGDRLGRKSMLVWSLLLMGASTLCIGVLPNYAQIGIWAPILLVTLRFVQGFALGGEWGGAALMSVEHAPEGRRGLYGSFVALGLPAGVILSNLVFLVTSLAVTPEQFAAWAWRIPFLASAALVAGGPVRATSALKRARCSPRFSGCRRHGACRCSISSAATCEQSCSPLEATSRAAPSATSRSSTSSRTPRASSACPSPPHWPSCWPPRWRSRGRSWSSRSGPIAGAVVRS